MILISKKLKCLQIKKKQQTILHWVVTLIYISQNSLNCAVIKDIDTCIWIILSQ